MINFIEREPESFNMNRQEGNFSSCLVDSLSGRTTSFIYKGTGSDLVSPTMVQVDCYNSEEEAWAEVEKVHIKDLTRVSIELKAYRDKLIKELEYVNKQIKD